MDELIKLGAQNGIWALLSVSLLVYTLRENKEREKGYQEIISKLSDTINCDITGLKTDVEEIKEMLK